MVDYVRAACLSYLKNIIIHIIIIIIIRISYGAVVYRQRQFEVGMLQ